MGPESMWARDLSVTYGKTNRTLNPTTEDQGYAIMYMKYFRLTSKHRELDLWIR